MYSVLIMLLTSFALASEVKYFDVKFDKEGVAWYRGRPENDVLHSLKGEEESLLKVEKQDSLAITFKPARNTLFRVFAGQYDPEVDKSTEEAKWGQKLANGDGIPDYRATQVVSKYKRYEDPHDPTFPEFDTSNVHLKTLLYILHSSGTFKKAIATLEKFQKEPLPVTLGSLAAVLNSLDHGKVPEKSHIQALETSVAGHDSLDSIYAALLEVIGSECEFSPAKAPLGLAHAPLLPLCYLRVRTMVRHNNRGIFWNSYTEDPVQYEDTPLFTLDNDQTLESAFNEWRSDPYINSFVLRQQAENYFKKFTTRHSNSPEYIMVKVACQSVKNVSVDSEFCVMPSVYYHVSMIINGQDIFVHDMSKKQWKKLGGGKFSPCDGLPPDTVKTGSIFLIRQHKGAAEKYQVEMLKEYKIRPSDITPVVQGEGDEGISTGSSDEQPTEGKSRRGLWFLAVILLVLIVLAVTFWYVRQRKPESKLAQPVFNEKA